MTWYKPILAVPMWLYRWSNKLLLHIWIGLPLLGVFVGMSGARSEWVDVYPTAIRSPSFWKEGVIIRPDLRGDKLKIRGHNIYLMSQGIRGISGAVYQLDATLYQAKADIISYNSNNFHP